MSFSRRLASSGFFLTFVVLLVGCSEDIVVRVGADAASFAKPEGCGQSVCDVQYDRCRTNSRSSASSSGSGSPCSECWRVCSSAVLDVPSCPGTCQSICDGETARVGAGSDASSSDSCASSLQACQATTANLGCADGVDPRSVPYALEGQLPLVPPLSPHRGVCTESELTTFASSCGPRGNCNTAVSRKCRECLKTPSTASAWGAWVIYESSVAINIAGCVANQGNVACATKIHAASECTRVACPGIDSTCFELAMASSCKTEIEESKKCETELTTQPAFASCFGDSDGFREVLAHFCGD